MKTKETERLWRSEPPYYERVVGPADHSGQRFRLRAAARLGREVLVPAVILAELYRGPRHNQVVYATRIVPWPGWWGAC